MPVTMLAVGDQHWYRNGDEGAYLPSVSTILGILKDGLEYVSAYDLRLACERGIKVHAATETLERGQVLLREFYSDKEYEMLAGFVQWYADEKPTKVLASELAMADAKLGFAGTLDRVYLMPDGSVMLLDLKTTSQIYDKHWMQVSAYAQLAKKLGFKVNCVAILRLTDKSKKRYQFEVIDSESMKVYSKQFNNIFKVWKDQNGDKQPKVSDLPDCLSLELSTPTPLP